jgi:hypothetical protein
VDTLHTPAGVPSLIIICGDPRLHERYNELFAYYWWLDGVPPYTMMNAGAGDGSEHGISPALLWENRLFFQSVGHVHLEHHIGTLDLVMLGCAQYRELHRHAIRSERPLADVPYSPEREDNDHRRGLEVSTQRLRDFARERGRSPGEPTLTVALFRLTNVDGGGEEEFLLSERELPQRQVETKTALKTV